jgi:rubrerythrin
MSSDGGKGSARRKEDVSKIHENWDRIFGKKKEETSMIDEHDDDEIEHDDSEWSCDVCGGPMYSAPHWNYGKCDDCGATQELINDDYT